MHLGPTLFASLRRWSFTRVLLALLMFTTLHLGVRIAWAAPSAQVPQQGIATNTANAVGDGITWRVCNTNICFRTQEAKDRWAEQNNCQFLDDVCSRTTPDEDNAGAQDEDQGFWGDLWDEISGAVVYGYEFVKGLYAGLKEQVTDLIQMFTQFDDVVAGLVQLGQAFFDDPQGTLLLLADMLGQEAVNTITRATQCGAYDLGQVIGSYVSPAFALKLASKLTRYSGRLADAARDLKLEYGCASFGAGTLVMTPRGLLPIEQVADGQEVLSRNETSYADRPQAVTATFGRLAPGYRMLATETGSLRVTDEHPLWVQGKGWTVAAEIAPNDVLASASGDLLVTGNDAVAKPLRVYNFSVGRTPSYFVGTQGVWAHNANCSIELNTKAFDRLTRNERGYRGERTIFVDLLGRGYQPVGRSFDPRGKPPDEHFAEWNGQTGIDAIYRGPDGKYVIVESKATGGTSNSDPSGCVARLCLMSDGQTRQMSRTWIEERLPDMVPDPVERQRILDGLNDGSVDRVYAQTDPNGTIYNVINETDERGVEIGDPWDPNR